MVCFPVGCQAMGIDTRVKSRFFSPPMLCRDASAAALVYPRMAHACYEVMGNDNDNNTKSVMGLGNRMLEQVYKVSMGKELKSFIFYSQKDFSIPQHTVHETWLVLTNL